MAVARQPFETAEGQGFPTVRQLSLFLENRCGQLLRLTQIIEQKDLRILALSVVDAVDCAIVRLLTDDVDRALEVLRGEGFTVCVAELLVVKLPPGGGLLRVWSALLSGEINVNYAYPLLARHLGAAMAVSVDSIEIAADTLLARRFEVLGEGDLRSAT